MFIKKTLIVVGAGASNEVDIPTGEGLKNRIAQMANIKFRGGVEMVSGDKMIYEAVQQLSNRNLPTVNSYLQAGRIIHDAMPQAISIDNFIDSHQGNKEIEIVGKLSIVKAILDAERHCKFILDSSRTSKLNFEGVKDTWFNSFVQLLGQNCRAEQVQERLSKIQFIVFNYDRCIEHYLYHYLQNYYNISEGKAAEIVSSIKIYHPYGTVGNLPWHLNTNAIEFGGEPDSSQLLALSNRIKTFTESNDPNSKDIISIHEEISNANIVLFLGFAYHPQNLKLIYPETLHQKRDGLINYYGTTKGMSLYDVEILETELSALSAVKGSFIHINNPTTCAGLFKAHWRSLSLS